MFSTTPPYYLPCRQGHRLFGSMSAVLQWREFLPHQRSLKGCLALLDSIRRSGGSAGCLIGFFDQFLRNPYKLRISLPPPFSFHSGPQSSDPLGWLKTFSQYKSRRTFGMRGFSEKAMDFSKAACQRFSPGPTTVSRGEFPNLPLPAGGAE